MAGVADRREVLNALSIIQGARLPHPLGVLLCSFVNEAMNPVVASRYVLSLNSEGSLLGAALNWIYIVESGQNSPLANVFAINTADPR
jgi:hypothetical protein